MAPERGVVRLLVTSALVATTLLALPAEQTTAATSCSGFQNRSGVTSSSITIANVADLSGPFPGLGRPALDGVKAFARYFNATSSVCGRKLKVLSLDSKTDGSATGAAYTSACSEAFAAVGSWSLNDDAGAWTAQKCGLPDLRSTSLTDARNRCTTCFGAQASQANAFPNAVPDHYLADHHAASQAAAMVYLNNSSYAGRAKTMMAAEQVRGMTFVYSAPIPVAAFDYGPYVSQMKSQGVQLVQFVGPPQQAARLARAMHEATYAPLYQPDPGSYVNAYVSAAGTAGEGTNVAIDTVPFAERASNTELRRYLTYLREVHPGAAPTVDGLFAWSAARLFVERAQALGGRLTRANLVTAVRAVHQWTDHGAHASQNVGSKVVGTCWRFLQLSGGAWVPVGGTSYRCDGRTVVPTP